MTLPAPGTPAPGFSLCDQDEKRVNLSDYLGRFVVIYFYPKALTSGCTVQACGLRDNWSGLASGNVAVLGISPDKPKLLRKFKDAERLPFDLLSDSEHLVAEAYGCWQEKSMYGRKYMGMARNTFIINPDGEILEVLQKVTPSKHAEDVLALLRKHGG